MIAIVDYRAGNLTSVKLAFEAIGAESEITSTPEKILAAERVVFPGVGAAGAAMSNLRELGLLETVREIARRGTPFLGICLGTQIIFDRSEEDGGTACIGLISGSVRLFKPSNRSDKVPQMGWNDVAIRRKHALFDGVPDGGYFYFVHSYYPVPEDEGNLIGMTRYADVAFASVIAKDNIIATQFHPEKSGKAGLRLLENFRKWKP